MKNSYDCIIIGGGIIGCAVGYYCAKMKKKVLLIEKDYLGSGSTGRCIGGIRQQFSSETTIKIAMESVRIFREFGDLCEWYSGGYLFLAHNEKLIEDYKKGIALQRTLGLNVDFIPKEEVLKLIPNINSESLFGGAYCRLDGQANPFLTIKIFSDGIKKLDGKIHTQEEVSAIKKREGVFYVDTNSNNKYSAPFVVNCAGPWISDIGKMLGIELPAYPERHEALITEPVAQGFSLEPMIVDYREDGCYFVQRYKTKQIIGCYTPLQPFKGKDIDSSAEFLMEMPRRMIRLLPSLSDVKVIRQWGGSYTMTPDGNPLVGETEIEGFYVAGAMCGHGFMLGPYIGKIMAELIFKGEAPIDISEFSTKREFKKKEVFR